MIEYFLEIFMDDFSIFGDSFDQCLHHLELILQHCIEKNLSLNWEKCHFMVKKGIIMGQKISRKEIEVDKMKVKVIVKLRKPKCVKDIRSFLRHARFYHRFIKKFNRIARPFMNILAKDMPLNFDDKCLEAWEKLKKELISALIISVPDWTKPFEIMCDASNFLIGSILR